jgi:hypothetical protein
MDKQPSVLLEIHLTGISSNYRALLSGIQVNAGFFVKQSHSQAINWA